MPTAPAAKAKRLVRSSIVVTSLRYSGWLPVASPTANGVLMPS